VEDGDHRKIDLSSEAEARV
jgi:hypothetical protein